MNVEIVPMTMDDYDGVLAIWRAAEGVGVSDADSRENIARYLQRNPGMSFVARCGTAIAGAVLCGHDGRRGFLHHLAVAPEYRRQGIGTALVEASCRALRGAGLTKCHLFVFAANADGRAFWAGASWVERPELRIMSRSLAE